MQYKDAVRAAASWLLALPLAACTSSPTVVQYSATPSEPAESEVAPRFELFTHDARLHESALRAQQRIANAVGDTGITLAAPDGAEHCRPFQPGCGFELSFADVVYCPGDPDPALACTSQGVGGTTVGIEMQASLAGEELDNRLIHELFHVITLNRAPHATDGLFMEYSVGDERISEGTLHSVCRHFPCSRFVIEEELAEAARGILLSHF